MERDFIRFWITSSSPLKLRGAGTLADTVTTKVRIPYSTRWRQQMETFSALLDICAGNSSVTGEFPPQRPVTRSFDAFFDLRLNKRLSKQSWGWWFETPSCSSWRHCNACTWRDNHMKNNIHPCETSRSMRPVGVSYQAECAKFYQVMRSYNWNICGSRLDELLRAFSLNVLQGLNILVWSLKHVT